MRLSLIIALCFVFTGCAGLRSNLKNHPYPYIMGMIAASAITSYELARKPGCPSTINGYPYNGTPPCPPPNWEPSKR